ncbi:MAG: hypothetical protein M3Z25_03905 [Actinomycetota bacterium]|nr:hypothetical protein [Actinomycetota bacterium]
MSSTLRAEFYFDADGVNWHFRVPALHIVGDGTATRELAEAECLDAIAFALEGDPRDYDTSTDAVDLRVSVEISAG